MARSGLCANLARRRGDIYGDRRCDQEQSSRLTVYREVCRVLKIRFLVLHCLECPGTGIAP